MALCEEPHKAASLGAGIGRPGRAGLQGGHEMAELSRPVGFGLASRGSVSAVVAWSEQARREGLDSVWVHDSYFERDAVTYASAIASGVGGIRVGMGALNPLTRHPVLVAMTVSAIEVLAAAVEYGRSAPLGAAAPATPVPAAASPAPAAAAELSGAAMPAPAATGDLGGAARPELRRPWTARRLAAWFEIARPFSFTASTVPVAAGGALAALDGRLDWPLFVAALLAGVLLHVGTNITNEIYDVRKGIDSITSPRASHALLKGRLSEHEAFALAATAFAGSMAIGIWLVVERGWPVAVLGVLGLVGGLGYTAPPLEYKFHALGPPLMFLLMGPLMVVGSYYVSSGTFTWAALVASLPVGLLVTAILHGNEWRDVSEDARAGISTMSIRAGRHFAHELYLALVIGAYLVLALAVAVGALPPLSLLAMLSLPLLVRAVRASELGATGQQRAIAMLDLETAQLHAAFGFLLVVGLAIAAVVR